MNKINQPSEELLFYTSNDKKVEEAQAVLGFIFKMIKPTQDVREIQSLSIEEVIKDKAIKAYKHCDDNPVMVEHTGLFIKKLDE